jgi:hypothetical protein
MYFQGAGSVSCNAVTGSSVQTLATVAALHFIKVLDIEGEKNVNIFLWVHQEDYTVIVIVYKHAFMF